MGGYLIFFIMFAIIVFPSNANDIYVCIYIYVYIYIQRACITNLPDILMCSNSDVTTTNTAAEVDLEIAGNQK